MIENIIFDLGGVILKHKKSLTEKILSSILKTPPDNILPIWKKYKPKIVKGEINSREFLNKLKKEFKYDKSVDDLITHWKELYKKASDINFELLDMVEKLKKNYKVYLFTDTIDVHDEYNRTRNIYNRFHQVLKSFEEKISKTDIEAFDHLLKKINSLPEKCLFIDDNKGHVSRASRVGIKTILFKDMKKLLKSLRAFGITL